MLRGEKVTSGSQVEAVGIHKKNDDDNDSSKIRFQFSTGSHLAEIKSAFTIFPNRQIPKPENFGRLFFSFWTRV